MRAFQESITKGSSRSLQARLFEAAHAINRIRRGLRRLGLKRLARDAGKLKTLLVVLAVSTSPTTAHKSVDHDRGGVLFVRVDDCDSGLHVRLGDYRAELARMRRR